MILTKIIVASVSNISLIAIEEPDNSVYSGCQLAVKLSLQVIHRTLSAVWILLEFMSG